MASPHLSRRVILRVIITGLTLAIPAAWAIGTIRTAVRHAARLPCRARPVPGLPVDGEPLTADENRALIAIIRGLKHPERSQA